MYISKNIFIRVDASFQIGLGHLKRCLIIAHQLHTCNYNPIIVLNADFECSSLCDSPFEIVLLHTNTDYELIRLVERFNCRTILFDVLHHYTINNLSNLNNLLNKLKEKYLNLIGIGDYEPFDLSFDIQINPYRNLNLNGFVSGYEYVVISEDIKKKRVQEAHKKKRILISFGGSDVNMVTHKIINILKQSQVIKDDWIVGVFIGEFFSEQHVNNINNLVNNDHSFELIDGENLHAEMHQYKLGIISGGITKFELAYLGIPAIIVSQFKEEKIRSVIFSKKGSAYYLCDFQMLLENATHAVNEIEKLICNKRKMSMMSNKGKKIIDGFGAQRIVKLIDELSATP